MKSPASRSSIEGVFADGSARLGNACRLVLDLIGGLGL